MQENDRAERMRKAEHAASTTIKRLTREIAEIEKAFHGSGEPKDVFSKVYQLEVRRDDLIRASVLHLHTSIEQLIDGLIIRGMLDVAALVGTGKRGKALQRMLFGGGSLGFDMKLNFAVALGVMNEPTRSKLMELNTLRNRCSHYLTLTGNVRQGKRRGQKKPPLLNFRGRHLHSVQAFQAFADEYWDIWLMLHNKSEKLLIHSLSRLPAFLKEERESLND